MQETFFEELRKEIMSYFTLDGSHGFDHTQRVYNLAIQIGKEEKADLDVVRASALLHDIARHKEEKDDKICHAKEGAKMAEEILNKKGFNKDRIHNVLYCILVHRYSKGLKPETKEAEILQDADRLDALGAICIARVFGYGGKRDRLQYDPEILPKKEYKGESETSMNHFYEKILKIKPEGFHTKRAKEIARERYAFIQIFIDRFIKEWNGEL